MAAVIAGTPATSSASASTSLVVALPGGIAAGDLLLLSFSDVFATPLSAIPDGWAQVPDAAAADGFGATLGATLSRIADGSEGASVTLNFSGSVDSAAICFRITGQHPTAPINIAGPNSGTTDSTTAMTAPSVTTTVDGCLIVRWAETRESSAIAVPGGTTPIAEAGSGTSSTNTRIRAAHSTQSTAGATGTADFVSTGAGREWVAVTIAVSPATAPPQTAVPNADVSNGAWVPSAGSDNHAVLADGSDATHSSTTSNSTLRVGLQPLSTPGAGTQTVSFSAAGSPAKRLIVSLLEAAGTLRGSLTVDPLPLALTPYSFNPSGITDYADLDVSFEVADATSPPTAQVTYGGIGTGASGTTSAAASYTGIGTINAATSDLWCVVTGRGNTANTAPTMPAGWTAVLDFEGGTGTWGVDAGTRRDTVFRKDTVTGTESGTVMVSLAGTTANTLRAVIIRTEKPAGYTVSVAASAGADTTSATSFSATGSTAISLQPNDLLMIVVASASDTATQSAQSITASGITFGTRTNRASTPVTNGNDHRHIIDTVPVSSGSGTVAPTYAYTASAATSGPVGFLRMRAVPPAVFGLVSEAKLDIPAASSGSINISASALPLTAALAVAGDFQISTPIALNLVASPIALAAMMAVAGDVEFGTGFNIAASPIALAGAMAVSGDVESRIPFDVLCSPVALLGALAVAGDVSVSTAVDLQASSLALAGSAGVSGDIQIRAPFHLQQSGALPLAGALSLVGDIDAGTAFDLEQGELIALSGELEVAADLQFKPPWDLQPAPLVLTAVLAVNGDVAVPLRFDVEPVLSLQLIGAMSVSGDIAAQSAAQFNLSPLAPVSLAGNLLAAGDIAVVEAVTFDVQPGAPLVLGGGIAVAGDIAAGAAWDLDASSIALAGALAVAGEITAANVRAESPLGGVHAHPRRRTRRLPILLEPEDARAAAAEPANAAVEAPAALAEAAIASSLVLPGEVAAVRISAERRLAQQILLLSTPSLLRHGVDR